MFSGIIEELGKVKTLEHRPGGAVLTLNASLQLGGLSLGDSVAVNGVCLTVATLRNQEPRFDLSDETLSVTNLGQLKPDDLVNLEGALRVGDRLGGHFVSGHIDEVNQIAARRDTAEYSEFDIEVSASFERFLVPKGSVAVDGISLTVAKLAPGLIGVVIIPHTMKMTTLGRKGPGASVNLEADMIGKYVARLLPPIDHVPEPGGRGEK